MLNRLHEGSYWIDTINRFHCFIFRHFFRNRIHLKYAVKKDMADGISLSVCCRYDY